MTDYCDLNPHVRLSEAAEYTGIGVKTIQKYVSVEKLIQPFESPEKKGGWYLFGRMDFTRLLIIKNLIERGMRIPDVRIFMRWLDSSQVSLLKYTDRILKLQDLQERGDSPNHFEINIETDFGSMWAWRGGEPPAYDAAEGGESPGGAAEDGEPPAYDAAEGGESPGGAAEDGEPHAYDAAEGGESPGGVPDKLSLGRVLNYDPFPTQISKHHFYNDEPGYPKPPVEASGWLKYWMSIRQELYVDQYRATEERLVHHLLIPVQSLESEPPSKAAKYKRLWAHRILGEITLKIIMIETSSPVTSFRTLDLARIKAEVAERILNPPEAIRQRHGGSS